MTQPVAIGLIVGHGYTKILGPGGTACFPSVAALAPTHDGQLLADALVIDIAPALRRLIAEALATGPRLAAIEAKLDRAPAGWRWRRRQRTRWWRPRSMSCSISACDAGAWRLERSEGLSGRRLSHAHGPALALRPRWYVVITGRGEFLNGEERHPYRCSGRA